MAPEAELGDATAAEGEVKADHGEVEAESGTPATCEAGESGAAADGEAASGAPAEGDAAEGREEDGKIADASVAKVEASETGYVLNKDGNATGLVLADGTRLLLAPEGADCLSEPAAVARTGDVCANGKPFTMAPRKKRAVDTGAALAQEYFGPVAAEADVPPEKRLRTGPGAGATFAPALLEKAPGSVQTCHSLLKFLEKKLEAPLPEAPEYDGPRDLKRLLAAHADKAGRIAAFKESSGWDARARRILDVPAAATSELGVAALVEAGRRMEDAEAVLDQELKERGEVSVKKLTKELVAWSKECVRREWFGWCVHLLRAQEALLLAGSKAAATSRSRRGSSDAGLDALGIMKVLLRGSAMAS